MWRGDLLQRTVAGCAAAAALAVLALALAGHWLSGVALAIGLVMGSANGFLARRALGSDLGFRATSLGRLAVLSAAGIGAGLLLGLQTLPLVIIGIGLAQLVLALLAALESARR